MQFGLLQSVFQLAVEGLGLYMLLLGLGRVHTAQRAIEPLSLYGGVGGDNYFLAPSAPMVLPSMVVFTAIEPSV